MTHDKLLVKLEQRYWKMFNHNSTDQSDSGTEHRILIQQSYFALQKVVELHKPKYWENIHDPSWNGNDCSICFTDGNLEVPSSKITSPCPTIQAIEKELA